MLAQDIKESIKKIAKKYIDPEKEINTAEDAIDGAKDIIAEIISDNSQFRKKIRQNTFYTGQIETKAKEHTYTQEHTHAHTHTQNRPKRAKYKRVSQWAKEAKNGINQLKPN